MTSDLLLTLPLPRPEDIGLLATALRQTSAEYRARADALDTHAAAIDRFGVEYMTKLAAPELDPEPVQPGDVFLGGEGVRWVAEPAMTVNNEPPAPPLLTTSAHTQLLTPADVSAAFADEPRDDDGGIELSDEDTEALMAYYSPDLPASPRVPAPGRAPAVPTPAAFATPPDAIDEAEAGVIPDHVQLLE